MTHPFLELPAPVVIAHRGASRSRPRTRSRHSRAAVDPGCLVLETDVHVTRDGSRPDLPTSAEREEIRKLRRENYELRRANEILKAASVYFAKELDADRPK